MKSKKCFLLISFIFFLKIDYIKSQEIDLDEKYITLKDFIILKYDLFLKDNISEVFKGAGVFGVVYQEINYDVKIKDDNTISISIRGVMDKKRYKSKRYYPKLSDCNIIRNKIFTKKYGYSFFKQSLNYSVNEENISNTINNKILNISALDKKLKKNIIDNTFINIELIHPKTEKNIKCSGRIISTELK